MFPVKEKLTWHPSRWKDKELVYHEACTAIDKMDSGDYQRLKEDIGRNGILQPVQVQASSNAIVSGRNRSRAAVELGAPIPVEILDISDAQAWALSRSTLAGRHLTPTRLALLWDKMHDGEEKARKAEEAAAAKAKDKPEEEKPEKAKKKAKAAAEPKKNPKGAGRKRDAEAKQAGVSGKTLERVRRVKEKGTSAVWKLMDEEKVTANDAALVVDYDKEVQNRAAVMIKNGEVKTFKAALAKIEADDKRKNVPLKDGKGKDVPPGLNSVFEARAEFVKAAEFIREGQRAYKHLAGLRAGKYLPKECEAHLADAAKALDLYQPFAVAENEDGWVTKAEAQGK
jgi:hypothetical protein